MLHLMMIITTRHKSIKQLLFYLKCWRYPPVALYNCSLHKHRQDKKKTFWNNLNIIYSRSPRFYLGFVFFMLMFKWHTRCHSFIMCHIVFTAFICRSSIETYLKEVKIVGYKKWQKEDYLFVADSLKPDFNVLELWQPSPTG